MFFPRVLLLAAGFSSAVRLAITSHPNLYWLEEVVRTAAQRFGEWASASRTFSSITDLLVVDQREVYRLFKLHFLFHACSTCSSCLPDKIVVDCSYVLAVKASSPDVEIARLVALRYGGESVSVPGCLCHGTGTLYRLFSVVGP